MHTADVSDLMRRMVKENLLKFDGTPLFPECIANTVAAFLPRNQPVRRDRSKSSMSTARMRRVSSCSERVTRFSKRMQTSE